jgi:putative spermidine/putrescine transport system permease protein
MSLHLRRSAPYLLSLPLIVFMAVFFLLPLAHMMLLSFTPEAKSGALGLHRYAQFLGDSYYQSVTLRTLRVGLITTFVTLIMAYPVALLMRSPNSRWQSVIILIVISPLLTSVVVRTLSWVVLLSREGVINHALAALGLPQLRMIYNESAMVIGLTHVFFGYMVISLLTALRRIDDTLYDAAANLGASRFRMFLEITLPLSLPGILAGCILSFTLAVSTYATPSLLGGSRASVLAVEVYNLAIEHLAWANAATVATVLFLLISAVIWLATALAESGRRKAIFQ